MTQNNPRVEILPISSNQALEKRISGQEATEDLLYEFLKDHTKTTERSYRADLKEFFQFTTKHFNVPRLENGKMNFQDVKRVQVVKYKNYLESTPCRTGKPLAPNSVNRKLSSVASFFQFLLQREIVDKNPMMFCTRPKRLVVRPTEALNDKEMKDLFSLVLKKAPPMHACVILTMFTTGMRNAELRNIKVGDFNSEQGVRTLRYIGKGRKSCEIAIHPATSFYLDEYLKWMAEKGRPLSKDDYLFQRSRHPKAGGSALQTDKEFDANGFSTKYISAQNNKLSHSALGYIVRKWSRKINPNKRITPHSGRSSFITSLLENGVDLYQVSQAVSHSDTRVTQRYHRKSKKFKQSPVFTMDLF